MPTGLGVRNSETDAGAAAAIEDLKPSILDCIRRGANVSGWDSAERSALNCSAPSVSSSTPRALQPHNLSAAEPGARAASRLRDNSWVPLATHRAIAKAIAEGRAITPAAEWLVDNYYIVEEQIRQIGEDLPPGYYRQLPKLADGPLAGYPRVFGIAWAFVAHTDSRFDAPLLCRFVRAYQRVQPLEIGELWAVAITLRIVLVENLLTCGRSGLRYRRAARQQADGWPTGCSASTCPRWSRCSRSCGIGTACPCRPPSRSSFCTGCAIRTQESRRPSPGWKGDCRTRARRRCVRAR